MSQPTPLTVAVVGATGVVGQTMVKVLVERDFPVAELRLLASGRSAGRTVDVRGKTIEIQEAVGEAFDGVDIALFSAGADTSKELAPQAVARGATVIDNSAAWRMDPNVPLVVSQVNPDDLAWHEGIVANPNCSTMQLTPVLMALRDTVGLERVVVDTYQAVSGTGAEAIRGIPGVIVHGRYDMVCPIDTAFRLHQRWPEADLRVVLDAGHSAYEPGVTAELLTATDRFLRGARVQ